MQNPLSESYAPQIRDEDLIKRSIEGDKKALEDLVIRHQDWIYNIAVRMLHSPDDAKDALQETLIKIITKLSQFRGDSSFRTWAYRIAVNHILNSKRSNGEVTHAASFDHYAHLINTAPDADIPEYLTPFEKRNAVQEVKISCMFGMLLCLDREQRMVFILGSVLDTSDTIGAEIMEISKDNFRQRLSRARKDLHHFMDNQCGLVDKKNPCRCSKKTKILIDNGYVDPKKSKFFSDKYYSVSVAAQRKQAELESYMYEKSEKLFKEHPFYNASETANLIEDLINRDEFKKIFNLN
jgi:RNA polymerase sigma factor (sigma-70 family)